MNSVCLAVKTSDTELKPTAQASNVATAIKLALLQKQAEQGLGFNTKEYITESGEWEVPVTGTYRITVIGGGGGGQYRISGNILDAIGGPSGSVKTVFVSLVKGQKIDVVIGTGGVGGDQTGVTDFLPFMGGNTNFGDISSADGVAFQCMENNSDTITVVRANGAGLGGGYGNSATGDAFWYGGGGGAQAVRAGVSSYQVKAGNGAQGCVIAEWFDPEKATLPTINDTDLIPYVNLLQRLEAIETWIQNGGGLYNDEILITESGDFDVPYDGYYEVTCSNGGYSGGVSKTNGYWANGGASGAFETKIIKLQKGNIIPVTIGAGGISLTNGDMTQGGLTYFGDFTARENHYWYGTRAVIGNSNNFNSNIYGVGGGTGTSADNDCNALDYGAGGSAVCVVNNGVANAANSKAGNGFQGCVKLRFHNPNKPLAI